MSIFLHATYNKGDGIYLATDRCKLHSGRPICLHQSMGYGKGGLCPDRYLFVHLTGSSLSLLIFKYAIIKGTHQARFLF